MNLIHEKKYPQALEQFQEFERYAPALPQGYTGEGIALALSGKLEESTQALERALQIDPSYWLARRELGIVEWQLNRKEDAARDLMVVVKLLPNDGSANVILAEYSFEKKDYAAADDYFSRAPAQVSTNFRLLMMASDALIKTGHFKEAARNLESLSLTPSLIAQQQFRIASLLGEAKDYDKSLEMLQALPQDFPDPLGRGYGIAEAYYEEGRYQDCIRTLTQLKEKGIVSGEVYSFLGAVEEQSGNTLAAYDAFREGTHRFPRDDENYLNIATVAVSHLGYEIASEVLTAGIQVLPGDYKLFLTRGVVYTLRRDLHSAQADYEKALALAPAEPSVYVALGICFTDQNKYAEAIDILRRGIERGCQDVQVYYYLVDALFRQGLTLSSPEYREAQESVAASLKLHPDFPYSYLQRGRLELLSGQVSEAVADFEHARELEPASRAVLYQLALAYRQAGRKPEAEKLFAQVSQMGLEEDAEFRKKNLFEVMTSTSDLHQPVR